MSRAGQSYRAANANGSTTPNLGQTVARFERLPVRGPVPDRPGRASAHRCLPADGHRVPGHFPGRRGRDPACGVGPASAADAPERGLRAGVPSAVLGVAG
eukprot:11722145-Alexandrium_andersonii.AAC.1